MNNVRELTWGGETENRFHFSFTLWQFPLIGRNPVTSCLHSLLANVRVEIPKRTLILSKFFL